MFLHGHLCVCQVPPRSRLTGKYKLSARSYNKILKVSRTIADIQCREKISKEDVLEALSFREVENILYNKTPGPKIRQKVQLDRI